MDLTDEDLAQAQRMLVLSEFFQGRTVEQLLSDLSWLSQYVRFRHHAELKGLQVLEEIPELYQVARDLNHSMGADWTDPRTGVTYPPPEKSKKP